MSRWAAAVGWSLGAITVAIALLGWAFPQGRDEVGRPARGVVALIQRSSPSDDLFNGQFCAGVLSRPDLVLTAAHCVSDRQPSDIDAVIGADNLCPGGTIDGVRVSVIGIDIHPRYDETSGSFDLARLTLASVVGDQSLRTLKAGPPKGSELLALGWGSASVGGPTSCRLMKVQLRSALGPDCAVNTAGTNHSFDPDTMICAYPRVAGQDTCTGDSGGPLIDGDAVDEGQVVAIVSWGIGCGTDHPGVYARVGWP